jgi:hypothetical protein
MHTVCRRHHIIWLLCPIEQAQHPLPRSYVSWFGGFSWSNDIISFKCPSTCWRSYHVTIQCSSCPHAGDGRLRALHGASSGSAERFKGLRKGGIEELAERASRNAACKPEDSRDVIIDCLTCDCHVMCDSSCVQVKSRSKPNRKSFKNF